MRLRLSATTKGCVVGDGPAGVTAPLPNAASEVPSSSVWYTVAMRAPGSPPTMAETIESCV